MVGDVSVCWLPISLRELELLNRGRKPARTSATTADPAARAMTTRKAFSDGSVAPPMDMVIWAMTTPAMALANDVPRERIRVLKLLAAPVSDGGTAPMMRAGIAP